MKKSLIVSLILLSTLGLVSFITRATWLQNIAESLVCKSSTVASDAILIDHVVDNYLLFERAQRLQASNFAQTVLIPILTSEHNGEPNAVSLGFVEVMCRIARIHNCITFHAPITEPYSLNLALQSAQELKARGVKSVLLITSGFRSRRAYMVYAATFLPFGIEIHCQPVFGDRALSNWTETKHGIQEVVLQFGKLMYYRLFVMR